MRALHSELRHRHRTCGVTTTIMSDSEIRALLHKLNNEPDQRNISIALLRDNVFYGTVATDLELDWERNGGPRSTRFTFYFIQSDDHRFVGAIQDGGGDLHWYVARPYRGARLLSNALRRTILPHIAASGRTSQQITINPSIGRANFGASQHLALALGFQLVDSCGEEPRRYQLDLAPLRGSYSALNP